MKAIKSAGLCLAAIFAVSLAASATASAAPTWKLNGVEIKGTEKVALEGTLTLKDTKTIAGVSEIECSFSTTGNEGAAGPGKYGRITAAKVEASKCKPVKVCENVEEVKALNLPWQTELYESNKEIRNTITATTAGQEPGWSVKCKVLISKTDECTTEAGWPSHVSVTGRISIGIEIRFDAKTPKQKCTEGGAGSGEILGSVLVKAVGGGVLSVS